MPAGLPWGEITSVVRGVSGGARGWRGLIVELTDYGWPSPCVVCLGGSDDTLRVTREGRAYLQRLDGGVAGDSDSAEP